MDEHQRLVVRVSDWLNDKWDWDQIGAALGLSPQEAYQRFAGDVVDYERTSEVDMPPSVQAEGHWQPAEES